MPFHKKRIPEEIPKENPNNSRTFKYGDNGSDNLANNHFQFLEFFHLPSSYFVAFKAYLESFSDDYRSDWARKEVYGRMDPIATFKKTTRTISVGFKVVASSVQEAEQNMRRISLLLQMLYPSYESPALQGSTTSADKKESVVSTIKGSPLFKVKFLNWITNSYGGLNVVSAEDGGLLGYIDGFSFTPQLDGGVFQVGLDLYPKYVDLNFSLNVIHEHPLGWDVAQTERNTAPGEQSFLSGPVKGFGTFPYGKNTLQDKTPKKNKMSSEQESHFKELQMASARRITGE